MLNEVVGLVPHLSFHFILFLFGKGVEGTLTSPPRLPICRKFVSDVSLSLKWNSSVWGLDELSRRLPFLLNEIAGTSLFKLILGNLTVSR